VVDDLDELLAFYDYPLEALAEAARSVDMAFVPGDE
jgi:hypothetical protein